MSLYTLTKSAIAITCGTTIVFASMSFPAALANKPQARQGLPGRRISGGVRSECFADSTQSLVALTPRNLLGKTALARPAFWFSLPETHSTKSINFALFDSADNLVYRTQVDRSDASGLSKIELPPTAPALAKGENYRWVFDIGCESNLDTASLEVQGWVRRVDISADISRQISSAGLEEQAYLYEEADLWHEQIAALAELRDRNPESLDAQLKWAAFIQKSGLESNLSNDPLETTISAIGDRTTRSAF